MDHTTSAFKIVIRCVSKKFGELYQKTNKNRRYKQIKFTVLPARSRKYGGLLSVSPPEEHHERRTFCGRGGSPRKCDSGSAIDS
jgi:hypothetical protein